jgi:hypothetical protein
MISVNPAVTTFYVTVNFLSSSLACSKDSSVVLVVLANDVVSVICDIHCAMPIFNKKVVKLVRCNADGELPQDQEQLTALYETTSTAWRKWAGPKPVGPQLAKINATIRQISRGDCPADVRSHTEFERQVNEIWHAYTGMPRNVAMRWFLVLVRRVEPSLLQAKYSMSIPWGFPKDKATGIVICPYSNSVRGCPHPLIDFLGRSLERELQTNEDLADFVKLQVRKYYTAIVHRASSCVYIYCVHICKVLIFWCASLLVRLFL